MEAKVDGRLDQKIVFLAEGVKRKSLKISFRSIKILQTILVRTLYKNTARHLACKEGSSLMALMT